MDQNIIIAAAAGFFIGAVLVWIIKNTNQSNAEHLQEESEALRKEYEALKKTFADYRNNVSNHFAKTADAVDQLTDSYKNVYNHLSAGARALIDKESLQKQIEKRQGKSVTLAYLAQNQENDKAAPIDTPQAETPAKPAAAEPAKTTPPAKPAPAEPAKTPPPAKPAPPPKPPRQNPQKQPRQPNPLPQSLQKQQRLPNPRPLKQTKTKARKKRSNAICITTKEKRHEKNQPNRRPHDRAPACRLPKRRF